jgi:cation:H+ antiporter
MVMWSLFLWGGLFVVSLAVLVKASDYFVRSSEVIGKFLRLPAFIIGVTLVAIGTSLPELASSIFAVFSGASEIVVANVVGSNIANIFLILGITAIVAGKIKILHEIIHVDLPLLIGSAFLLALTIWDGVFTFIEALLFIGGLILYLGYTVSTQEKHEDIGAEKKIKKGLKGRRLDIRTIFVFLISAVFIFLGAKYTVDSVIELSGILNIGTEVIAIIAIALGTSLPELVVSISAVRKKKAEIAVGNILGSSIFNIFGVMGITGLFGVLIVPEIVLTLGLPLMLMATLMYFFIAQDRDITKWEGWMLLLFYVFFVLKLFGVV